MEICKLSKLPKSNLYILSFCRPLHNAVVMSNVKLVKRFSAVLSALGRSLDIFNKYGEVSDIF